MLFIATRTTCMHNTMFSIHTALDVQFSQEVISGAEENGTVRVCVEIVTDIFLPINVEIRVFTQDGNATGNYRIARIFRGYKFLQNDR